MRNCGETRKQRQTKDKAQKPKSRKTGGETCKDAHAHAHKHTHLSKGRGDCGEEVVVDVEWGDVWHGSEELRRAPGVEGAEEVLLRAENTELLKLVVRVM